MGKKREFTLLFEAVAGKPPALTKADKFGII